MVYDFLGIFYSFIYLFCVVLLVYIGWLSYAMPFIICQLFNCVNS